MTVYVIVKDAHKVFPGRRRETEFSIEEGECANPGGDTCQVTFSKGLKVPQELPVFAFNVFLRKEEAEEALIPLLENSYDQFLMLTAYNERSTPPNKKDAKMYSRKASEVEEQLSLLRARPTKTAFDRIFRK